MKNKSFFARFIFNSSFNHNVFSLKDVPYSEAKSIFREHFFNYCDKIGKLYPSLHLHHEIMSIDCGLSGSCFFRVNGCSVALFTFVLKYHF